MGVWRRDPSLLFEDYFKTIKLLAAAYSKLLKSFKTLRLIALCKMYVNVFIFFSSGPYLDMKGRLEYLKWSRLEVSRLLFVKVCQEIF